MTATDPAVEAVAAVVQARALSIDDAWAVLAAARPFIAAEALRAAADDVQQIDGRRDDAARDWLRARADDLEAGR